MDQNSMFEIVKWGASSRLIIGGPNSARGSKEMITIGKMHPTLDAPALA